MKILQLNAHPTKYNTPRSLHCAIVGQRQQQNGVSDHPQVTQTVQQNMTTQLPSDHEPDFRVHQSEATQDSLHDGNYGWLQHHNGSPWSNMKCSQPTAWTTNRSLLVASRVKDFHERQTNSGSTLHRAAQLKGSVIGRHQRLHLSTGNFSCISRNATNPPSFSLQAYEPSYPPLPHQIHHS